MVLLREGDGGGGVNLNILIDNMKDNMEDINLGITDKRYLRGIMFTIKSSQINIDKICGRENKIDIYTRVRLYRRFPSLTPAKKHEKTFDTCDVNVLRTVTPVLISGAVNIIKIKAQNEIG